MEGVEDGKPMRFTQLPKTPSHLVEPEIQLSLHGGTEVGSKEDHVH